MQGVRFYLEHESKQDKRKGKHNGNVFAAFYENRGPQGMIEGMGAVYSHPNSGVAGTSASRQYLRDKCKRIPESLAREIHPALFERLND